MVDRPDLVRWPRFAWVWVGFVVVALGALELFDLAVYGVVVPIGAAVVFMVGHRAQPSESRVAVEVDRRDLRVIAGGYVVVVGLLSLAFRVFGTDARWGCSCALRRV